MTFNELEQVCAILRQYHVAAIDADEGGPYVDEADYAKRIEDIIG